MKAFSTEEEEYSQFMRHWTIDIKQILFRFLALFFELWQSWYMRHWSSNRFLLTYHLRQIWLIRWYRFSSLSCSFISSCCLLRANLSSSWKKNSIDQSSIELSLDVKPNMKCWMSVSKADRILISSPICSPSMMSKRFRSEWSVSSNLTLSHGDRLSFVICSILSSDHQLNFQF